MRWSRAGLNRASAPKISASGWKVTVVPRRLGAGPERLQRRSGMAARELLAVELPVAGDLDGQPVGQRVDDRDADAVQAARGRIGLAREFAARVQHGEDHLQRRLAREIRVRVDRDAAAVVADGQREVGVQLHLDPGGVAGHRLVHGVVEDLGGQVVQRPLVGAADVHARAPPDRLQPLQHLDGDARRRRGRPDRRRRRSPRHGPWVASFLVFSLRHG